MSEPTELTEADRAYMAALVDEKGVIYVQKCGGSLQLRLKLNGLGASTVAWIKARFKGAKLPQRGVIFVTSRASAVLAIIYSHLTNPLRKAQAQVVFKFNGIKPKSGRIWSSDEKAERWLLMGKINRPSIPPAQIPLAAPRLQVVRMTGGR